MFKKVPGKDYVSRKQYALQAESDGSTIDEANWDKALEPGTSVNMSILLQLTSGNNKSTQACPKCGTLNHQVRNGQQMLQW